MSAEPHATLVGRHAIVTGAAQGLGLSIARRLISGGAKVLLVDKDPAVLDRVRELELLPSHVFAVVRDLADPDAASFIFSRVPETIASADILVNNAAWSFHKPMIEVNVEEFDKVVAVNQRAPYFLTQELVRYISRLSQRPPDVSIVNIASVNALAGNPNLAAYAGTKGALVAMTRAMAVEMKDLGLRVNAISPAAIETFHTKQLITSGVINPPELLQPYLIKRFASCEEIAELVAYLCGPAASYVNGANWVIDGGYLAQ